MPKRRANGEGGITKRKDKDGKVIMWQAQYTDNTGTRRTLYGKNQQIVKDKLKAAIQESDKGMSMDKNKITFAEWLEEWLNIYKKPTIKESSFMRDYARVYHHVIPFFPKVLLKDLGAERLQKFFNEKAVSGRLDGKDGGLSVAERHKIKQIIVAALNQALDNRLISYNPAKKIKLPPHNRKEVTILTVDEQKRVEQAAMNHYNPLAFSVLLDLYTGLRVGELTALKITDVNFKKKELYVQRSTGRIYDYDEKRTRVITSEPKTAKGRRTIPLPVFIVDKLQTYIEERNSRVEFMREYWSRNKDPRYQENVINGEYVDNGRLFISIYGTAVDKNYFNVLFNQVLKDAGVDHINFHAIRHTFATRCLEAGFDIRSLSDILGHTDAKMTLNTYAHALSDQKRGNMDKLTGIWEFGVEKETF